MHIPEGQAGSGSSGNHFDSFIYQYILLLEGDD